MGTRTAIENTLKCSGCRRGATFKRSDGLPTDLQVLRLPAQGIETAWPRRRPPALRRSKRGGSGRSLRARSGVAGCAQKNILTLPQTVERFHFFCRRQGRKIIEILVENG